MGIFDLDIWKYEPAIKKINRSLMELYRTKDEGLAREILAVLDELAEAHIYFEFLRLDWNRRFEEAQRGHYKNARDLLPHKVISHIPSDIDMIQRQLIAGMREAWTEDAYLQELRTLFPHLGARRAGILHPRDRAEGRHLPGGRRGSGVREE